MDQLSNLSDSFQRWIDDPHTYSALLGRLHTDDHIPLSILRDLQALSIEDGNSQASLLREQLEEHLESARIHAIRTHKQASMIHLLRGENVAAIGFLTKDNLRSEYRPIEMECSDANLECDIYLKLTNINNDETLDTIVTALVTDSDQRARSSRPDPLRSDYEQQLASLAGTYSADSGHDQPEDGLDTGTSNFVDTTEMPTTEMPTTEMPTTEMPTSEMATTTEMPTTEMPVSDRTQEGPTPENITDRATDPEIPSENTATGLENTDSTRVSDRATDPEIPSEKTATGLENTDNTRDHIDKDPAHEQLSGSRAMNPPRVENTYPVQPLRNPSRSRSTELDRLTSHLTTQLIEPGVKRVRATDKVYARKQSSSKRTKGAKGTKVITGTSRSGTPPRRHETVRLRLHVVQENTNTGGPTNETPETPSATRPPVGRSRLGRTFGSTATADIDDDFTADIPQDDLPEDDDFIDDVICGGGPDPGGSSSGGPEPSRGRGSGGPEPSRARGGGSGSHPIGGGSGSHPIGGGSGSHPSRGGGSYDISLPESLKDMGDQDLSDKSTDLQTHLLEMCERRGKVNKAMVKKFLESKGQYQEAESSSSVADSFLPDLSSSESPVLVTLDLSLMQDIENILVDHYLPLHYFLYFRISF